MIYCPFCKKNYSKHYFSKHMNTKKCKINQLKFQKKFEILNIKSKKNKKSKKIIVYFD